MEPVGDRLRKLQFQEGTNTALIRLQKSQKGGVKHTCLLVPSAADMSPPRLGYGQTGGLEGVSL